MSQNKHTIVLANLIKHAQSTSIAGLEIIFGSKIYQIEEWMNEGRLFSWDRGIRTTRVEG